MNACSGHDALARGPSGYDAHLRTRDALFPAEGVEEIRLSILAQDRWIAKLLRGTIDFTDFRLLVGNQDRRRTRESSDWHLRWHAEMAYRPFGAMTS
jgi:hypothetical protein